MNNNKFVHLGGTEMPTARSIVDFTPGVWKRKDIKLDVFLLVSHVPLAFYGGSWDGITRLTFSSEGINSSSFRDANVCGIWEKVSDSICFDFSGNGVFHK